MGDVRTITYDHDIVKDFLQHFKRYKIFKQKAFYLGDGVTDYYELSAQRMADFFATRDTYYDFIKTHCLSAPGDGCTAFVSLGCGNAEKEEWILKPMLRDKQDVHFYGIDSSQEMVDLATDTFTQAGLDGEFICADFGKEDFLHDFSKGIGHCGTKIYAFLGATFGNVEQSYMADVLYDLLDAGDYLWLEVVSRQDADEKEDMSLFERYQSWSEQGAARNFLLRPLADLGINEEDGLLRLQTIPEDELHSLKFLFQFRIDKKVVTRLQNKTVTLLPGTLIDLLTVRAYDPKGLVRFFKERQFSFVSSAQQHGMGQFLFQRQ